MQRALATGLIRHPSQLSTLRPPCRLPTTIPTLTTHPRPISTITHPQRIPYQFARSITRPLTPSAPISTRTARFSSTATNPTTAAAASAAQPAATSAAPATVLPQSAPVIPPPVSTISTAAAEMAQPPQHPALPTTFPKFNSFADFTRWYLIDPPTYQRYSGAWWMSNSWLMLMYSVTGYSALQIVRKVLSLCGVDNVGLFRGEYHHRFFYFLLMTPTYSLLTLINGYIFGRPVYCARMVRRIWGRFLPWLKQKKA